MIDEAPKKRTSRIVAHGGLGGLALGILLGTLVHLGHLPSFASLVTVTGPVGELWVNALRATVVPLTACLIIVGVNLVPKSGSLGKVGGTALVWFAALLVAGGLVTVAVTKPYLQLQPPAQIALTGADGLEGRAPEKAEGVSALLPPNIFEAAASGDVLPIALMSAIFGLALRTIPKEKSDPVMAFFLGVRHALMVFVGWLLLALPVGAFALAFSFSVETGAVAAGAILHFVVYTSVLLGVIALVMVVLTVIAVRRPKKETLAAVSPLVAVAVGTRSSLASLPTMVASADALELPGAAKEVVLPLAVSVFKMNRTVSSTCKLLFMSAVFGFAVGPTALLVFIGTVILLSFGDAGIPSVGTGSTFGAYMAAGAPVEAIVVFEVTNSLTDLAKTTLNVVADFAVAVFTTRGMS